MCEGQFTQIQNKMSLLQTVHLSTKSVKTYAILY